MRRFGWLLPLALLAASHVARDDSLALMDTEIEARARFEAVPIGTSESDLRKQFGQPECTVVRGAKDPELLDIRCPEGTEPRLLPESALFEWRRLQLSPTWIATMPLPPPGARMLIFVDGTVYAYVFLDDRGQVQQVKAVVS
jgi:hypothetical protein